MAAFAMAGLAVASASAVVYGAPVTDPVELLGRFRHPVVAVLSLLGLSLAVVTTNIAANVVGPANALVNVAPQRIGFKAGGIAAAALGAVICPWRLLQSSDAFVGWCVLFVGKRGEGRRVLSVLPLPTLHHQLNHNLIYTVTPLHIQNKGSSRTRRCSAPSPASCWPTTGSCGRAASTPTASTRRRRRGPIITAAATTRRRW